LAEPRQFLLFLRLLRLQLIEVGVAPIGEFLRGRPLGFLLRQLRQSRGQRLLAIEQVPGAKGQVFRLPLGILLPIAAVFVELRLRVS
jgi:hypothetical protein